MFASQIAPVHERGAAIYSNTVLGIYDTLVVRVSNSWIWRSPSAKTLELYNDQLSKNHLEIGTGTGWHLAHARLPEGIQLSLLDLNPNALQLTQRRVRRSRHLRANQITTSVGNILEKSTLPDQQFPSIAANYLLHCLPGDPGQRFEALSNMASMLTDDGVLFGSTILGDDAAHNLAGRALMTLYNRLNIFDNRDDDPAVLHEILDSLFDHIDRFDVEGTVVTFSVSSPRR